MNVGTEPTRSTPTFVPGLDHVLGGGVPAGRATLVTGGPGAGKSVMAAQFVAEGARHGEPGLIVSFDLSRDRFLSDMESFSFDLSGLVAEGRVGLHHVGWQDVGTPTTGAFTLEGLGLQLDSLLAALGGARRLSLDSPETILAAAPDSAALRREFRRLLAGLADRGVTTVVTAERNAGTRHGMEEYLTDCVILLDYDVEQRIATRRVRVLKRRGASHNGDKHPFLISAAGLSLRPLVRSQLDHVALPERVPTGVAGLDDMLGGEGFYRGSSVLVSGTPGTGKSSLAAAFANAACERGETVLYVAYEESPSQIVRNMRSVGYALGRWIERGRLHVVAQRPSEHGLEGHLVRIEQDADRLKPDVAILDPVTSLLGIDFEGSTRSMTIRVVDSFKERGVTAFYTSLGGVDADTSRLRRGMISSLMDTWLVLRARRRDGRRQREVWVLKSRGMSHSTWVHPIRVGDAGLEVGPALKDRGLEAVST